MGQKRSSGGASAVIAMPSRLCRDIVGMAMVESRGAGRRGQSAGEARQLELVANSFTCIGVLVYCAISAARLEVAVTPL